MKKLNFCTLFDTNYLSRGLALYESLERAGDPFHLYIFPFDDTALAILKKLELKHATIIPLADFEDAELLALKPGRTSVEYCWTCTPSTILYCIEKFGLDCCTYLDADTYFFARPSILFEELTDGVSVIITEHRYTPKYDATATSGRYCVQFVTIRNDENGMKAVRWWREQCNEWCYYRVEEGRLGDQKYLDDWTTRFAGVRDLAHHGGGMAPWNIQRYELFERGGAPWAIEKTGGEAFPVVFFHFHALRFYSGGAINLNKGYDTPRPVRALIYRPYIIHLIEICERVGRIFPGVDVNATSHEKDFDTSRLSERLKNIVRRRRYEEYCVYDISEFRGIWRLFKWHV